MMTNTAVAYSASDRNFPMSRKNIEKIARSNSEKLSFKLMMSMQAEQKYRVGIDY
jgi:hypothetical protein